jgi:hypothetical protein
MPAAPSAGGSFDRFDLGQEMANAAAPSEIIDSTKISAVQPPPS